MNRSFPFLFGRWQRDHTRIWAHQHVEFGRPLQHLEFLILVLFTLVSQTRHNEVQVAQGVSEAV